jgi:calicheamicin 3'-O-methyl-rhamnosyltransferase
MRVLVAAVPQAGHLHPLFPLGTALRDRGHEVTFASAPSFARRAEKAGFPAVHVGGELDAWFAELARRTQGPPGDGLSPEEIETWFIPRLFGRIGIEQTLDDLVAALVEQHTDLVLHDCYQFAAPLAAALAGIPNVAHGLGPMPPFEVFAVTGAAVAPLWADRGQPVPDLAGVFSHAFLTISPPSLDVGLPAALGDRVRRLRPVGYDATGTTAPPEWLSRLPDRPTVYATLGTMFNTNREVFRAILDGLADEDVNVVMTVGAKNEPGWLGETPANARVESYIPQTLLLDRCGAVVSHGGSGTILPALTRGIPQVLVPQGADNFTNAARCAAAVAGVVLAPADVSAGAIRAAVRRALDEPVLRSAARAVAEEIEAMPGPNQVAADLERLT